MDSEVFIVAPIRPLQYLDLFDVAYDDYTQAYRIDIRHSLYYKAREHVLGGRNATKLLFNNIIKDIGDKIQVCMNNREATEFIKNCICDCLRSYEYRGIIVRFGESWIIDSGWVLTKILVPSP